jgi:ribonuclease HI
MIEIYTDGACSGNPGKGGWGALLRYDGVEKELSGYEPMTTNNRMEMMGVIKALEALKKPSTATIYSDSQYVIKGMTEWLKGWKAKGWKTASKGPVKNVDLWQQLDALAAKHTLTWQWVKGHNNHAENERVDALARGAIAAVGYRKSNSPAC